MENKAKRAKKRLIKKKHKQIDKYNARIERKLLREKHGAEAYPVIQNSLDSPYTKPASKILSNDVKPDDELFACHNAPGVAPKILITLNNNNNLRVIYFHIN